MTHQTRLPIEEQTAHALRALRGTHRASQVFHTEAAKLTEREGVRQLFLDVAYQHGRHAEELAAHLGLGPASGEPALSWRDALRAGWLELRGLLSRGDPAVLLRECLQAEERLQRTYEGLLEQSFGVRTRALLRSHHVDTIFAQDRLRYWLGQVESRHGARSERR